jgi:hypothetical protein
MATAGPAARFVIGKDGLAFYHPAAPLKRRGHIAITFPGPGQLDYRYLRCTADEEVSMQPTSWQRTEMVIAPSQLAPISATLESPHTVVVAPARWQELYGVGSQPAIAPPAELNALVSYHRDAIVRSMAVGDDWGNVTGYADAAPHGAIFGMNRLNHCAAIFEDGWRSGDRRLLETGVLWCDNFYDQSRNSKPRLSRPPSRSTRNWARSPTTAGPPLRWPCSTAAPPSLRATMPCSARHTISQPTSAAPRAIPGRTWISARFSSSPSPHRHF